MLFRRLLEKNARAALVVAAEGYVVSVIAHGAIIGGVLFATQGARVTETADSFTPVTFFVPQDRIQASRPKQERITFFSPAVDGGDGHALTDDDASRYREVAVAPGPGLEELSSQLESEPESAPEIEGGEIMTVLEVDSAVARYDDSAAPPYPPALLERRVEGSVGIQYVVDTTGYADTSSVVILSATHPEFASSVIGTLPDMRFRAAMMGGRKVRQLVQQLFAFRIDTTLVAQQKKQEKP